METLEQRVIAVTGASQGFGLEICRQLVAAGARVGMLARDAERLQQAVAELGAEVCFPIAVDVADREALAVGFEQLKSHFGAFDAVVANAGVARPGTVANLSATDIALQVNTNLLGTIFTAQAAIPLLRGASNARIVTLSSACAHHYDEMSHLSIYAATKAAVERFSRELRLELQEDGIAVTCLRPGSALTDFAGEWAPEAFQTALDDWAERGTYMDTGMDVSDVARAVLYALTQPAGVAIDLMEIRPTVRAPKSLLTGE